MTTNDDIELDEIMDKVSLNSSKGYTKVGLKKILKAWAAKQAVEAKKQERELIMSRLPEKKYILHLTDSEFREAHGFNKCLSEVRAILEGKDNG